jgi:hypothetical protein
MNSSSSRYPAVVSRAPEGPGGVARYLQVNSAGTAVWTRDPNAATAFASMREATRAATRLPGSLRAFGLPMRSEPSLRETVH